MLGGWGDGVRLLVKLERLGWWLIDGCGGGEVEMGLARVLDGGDAVVRVVLDLYWAWLVGWIFLLQVLTGKWVWACSLGSSFSFHVLGLIYLLFSS